MNRQRKHIAYFVFFIAIFSHALTVFCAENIRIRIMAANLTTGNKQSYEDPAKRIFQALKPDIVLIQEFNVGNNTTAEIDAYIQESFGAGFNWMREPGKEQIPNGIISRWRIVASGDWSDTAVANRDFAWARIDIPGDKDLWAVSIHLLTSNATARNTEATALKNYISVNVPAKDYLVIGGDLNTGNRTENAIKTLSAIVETASPYPADQNGNTNTNANREKPYDWVLPNSYLHALKTPLIIGKSIYPDGLVFDSRVYTPLSEVSPVKSTDSSATNMQHMAVVRDFLLELPSPDIWYLY
ncbi:MAG: hypothetical protein BWY12_01893 [candidate division BRC1 bacterium ADurb.Bin183]|jgi:endonuclease/exonuclease/phosphatase family metal-dependent hydrolase|nr:MAG: hypothetical protein BWY12_01893 [candidate division BRC1 bacterium ADurb.Bin183]